jgi:hypothetical protein
MEVSLPVKLIVCQTVLYTLAANIALLVLAFIAITIYQKWHKREHVQIGVKEKPKKSKKLDKTKVAYKKW